MHDLPCRGCNIKNRPTEPRSGLINNYLTPNHVEYVLQLLFYEIFCKVYSLVRSGFKDLGGQPEAIFFQTYMKTIPGS